MVPAVLVGVSALQIASNLLPPSDPSSDANFSDASDGLSFVLLILTFMLFLPWLAVSLLMVSQSAGTQRARNRARVASLAVFATAALPWLAMAVATVVAAVVWMVSMTP